MLNLLMIELILQTDFIHYTLEYIKEKKFLKLLQIY
jgi:hypothetical protein